MTAVPYLDGPLAGQWVEDDAPYRHASTGERANARKCRRLIKSWRRSTRTDPFLEIAVNEFTRGRSAATGWRATTSWRGSGDRHEAGLGPTGG